MTGLLMFCPESLGNLPSIWYNSDSMAGDNDDHYIHTNAGQLNLTLAQGLLQVQSMRERTPSSYFITSFLSLLPYLDDLTTGFWSRFFRCSSIFLSTVYLSSSSVIVSIPADDDVQDYQGDYREQDVEDGVHPQDIDIEVPVVDPHVSC